jgi:hypothetical protein
LRATVQDAELTEQQKDRMNEDSFKLASAFVSRTYAEQAFSARHKREKLIETLLSQVLTTFDIKYRIQWKHNSPIRSFFSAVFPIPRGTMYRSSYF